MPTNERLGTENREDLQDRWKPAVQLDKAPSIMVRQPDATMQPTPQDGQLMSKHRVLGFRPQLRLEWQAHDGQKETEQPDHSASLGDSITSSTRIRFSVHTALVIVALSFTPLAAVIVRRRAGDGGTGAIYLVRRPNDSA
jgi:hypothetical protein